MNETTAKIMTDAELTAMYNTVIEAKLAARREWSKQSVWTVAEGKTAEQAAAQLKIAIDTDAKYIELANAYMAADAAAAYAVEDNAACSCVELPGGKFVTCPNCQRENAGAAYDQDAVPYL